MAQGFKVRSDWRVPVALGTQVKGAGVITDEYEGPCGRCRPWSEEMSRGRSLSAQVGVLIARGPSAESDGHHNENGSWDPLRPSLHVTSSDDRVMSAT